MEDAFRKLEGQHLIAVSFLQHHLQLDFKEALLNVYTPITVDGAGATTSTGSEGFRDALCGQVAKLADSVFLHAKEALVIAFEDGSRVSISLRPDDYWAPEAVEARGLCDEWIAI